MITKSEIEYIKNNIIEIWNKNIAKDYNDVYLLREDTLKCSFYHHLRVELGTFFKQHNLAILTEFQGRKYICSNYRPDIVIVKMKDNCNEPYFIDRIDKLLFVIELKYKDGSYSSTDAIECDCKKVKNYVELLNDECQLVLAVIQECYWENQFWFDEEDKSLLEGRVTELIASYKSENNEELKFNYRCY